ncbi:class C beta-lactamase-related serine hydrolase [Croceicoccus ponticola]|uniref:Class C beta-lactamase-related serine hydrolase n=1 Tax=Croceicoccus ponticola TaxID=2217664 RepID=A0A437GZ53_9SPHN|nr:serine hydrolase [Croceicoccus ponticola]RVQ67685.1 class C beta-lactamase-related serine hydrolase [Croceicoccus ponticola]
MPPRLLPILAAALLPVLCACNATGGAEDLPPPSDESLASVAKGDAGASREGLARAIDGVFADDVGETRALVVMHDGKIVAERYAPGYGPNTRHVGWSMTKTVTGVVIGMLIADGSLALDQPAPLPRWQRAGDPRADITVRHLLQMRSGLRHAEDADPSWSSDSARMLFTEGRSDVANHAETQPLDADPGKHFTYSTASSVILADVATRALTTSDNADDRRDAMAGYLHERLFGPLGMASAVPEFDAHGTFVGGSMVHATARDWAKFGEMMRQGGVASNGVRVIPRSWIRFMTTPGPRDPAYGAHVWLNRERPEGRDPVLFPGQASDKLFAMLGFHGQYCVISPEQDLVIVRLGISKGEEQDRLNEAMAALIARFPAS